MWFTQMMGYVHKEIVNPFITVQKDWENSRVNPIPWVRNTVGQHTSQKKISGAPPPNPKAGGTSV